MFRLSLVYLEISGKNRACFEERFEVEPVLFLEHFQVIQDRVGGNIWLALLWIYLME